MKITYREYTNADKDVLLKLSNKLEEHQKSIDPLHRVKNLPGYAEMSLRDTLEKVTKYQGKIWLAEDSGEIAGYIVGVVWKQSRINRLEIGRHTLGEIIDLFVEEKYRNRGTGAKLLKMMEDYFKTRGCDSMWIQVFAPNHIARKVYKRYGFVEREIGMLKNI